MSVVLEVKNLVKTFPAGKKGLFSKPAGFVHAVDDVSLKIESGQTLGIVGESGCGKSTLGRVITHLLKATSGNILLNGKDITNAKGEELNQLRRTIQMIFQDPYSSLNPRHTVGRIVEMPLVVQKINPSGGRKKKVQELLELVGLNPEHYNRYPHEFSGGQRQRIGIARALYKKANVIIFDEATSSLDVKTERSVMNSIEKLNKNGLSEFKTIIGQSENGRNKWKNVEWQKPSFPLIKDAIFKDKIILYFIVPLLIDKVE